MAGDLSEDEHRPWRGPVDGQVARLSALWSDQAVDPRFVFVWLDLTASGRTWAEAALERVPDVD